MNLKLEDYHESKARLSFRTLCTTMCRLNFKKKIKNKPKDCYGN